ncbi:ATP-binding protein [Rhodonellum sp.]|uniref:ATP-binding protein n=1 Tax=Rhodonellum sp. TaxID=2231180 RepID=UPI002721F51A|nr:ATP-binding protein [Rhodonellum sp.]MDO9551672.1 ATP-binding protein [Rhodonellum sp.]
MEKPLKKIVILGPESTGKSTLTQSLAEHFSAPWVREYAREYLKSLDRPYDYPDLLEIAKGQIALEKEMESRAENFLFCDTNLLVIEVWSQHKFGKTDQWILETLQKREYDFILLTDIDIPWQDDPQREHPEPKMRQYFFDLYFQKIEASKIPFAVVSGPPEKRFALALEKIQNLLS